MAGYRDAHVERGAVRVHHGEPLRAIGLENVSVLPHVGMEDEDNPVFLGPIEQRLVHHAGMFDAPASIGPRILSFSTLDSCEYHVDLAVPIGVRRHLPTGIPPLLIVSVELFLRARRRNSKVAWTVRVCFAQPRRAPT